MHTASWIVEQQYATISQIMDFLDPKKRKAHNTRLYIGYALMGVLITMIAVLLLFQAYGYTFNIRTGNISQNGLLFVDASPQQANVVINGRLRGQTDQRLILDEGSYDISVEREGYHSWTQTVLLRGGFIERFQYPFLFPVNPETADAFLFAGQPPFTTQSPDRQWLLAQEPGSLMSFDLFNLNSDLQTARVLNLAEGLLTESGSIHRFELNEWSNDNRRVVLRHFFDDQVELVLVDIEEPTLSVNLSKTITTPFTRLQLRDKKFDQYYIYQAQSRDLLTYDLGTGENEVVVSNVIDFHTHGDDEMVYVTDGGDAASEQVSVRMVESGEAYTVKTLPRAEKYLLEMAQYSGKWYVVAGAASENKVYVLRNPLVPLRRNSSATIVPAAVLPIDNPEFVSFSQNAQFIALQSGSKFIVYDAENAETVRFDSELTLPAAHKVTWMDGHRLTAISEGVHTVFDFDGTNKHTLGSSYDGIIPYFNGNYSASFTIAPSLAVDGRAALQRTELIVDATTQQTN